MIQILQALCWLLPPSALKNAVLRRYGHAIAGDARIGPLVVFGVIRVELGNGACIGAFNVVKGMSLVRLGDDACIGSWNWISAAPEFQRIDARAGTLDMHRGAKIGSRNYLDCSGTIVIREYAWVGGNRTFLQTHEPDLRTNTQTAGRIVIGHHSLVHSCCVLLKGAELPERSVLETNSTMLPAPTASPRPGIYSGSPAKWVRETDGDWFDRAGIGMNTPVVDGLLGTDRGDRS